MQKLAVPAKPNKPMPRVLWASFLGASVLAGSCAASLRAEIVDGGVGPGGIVHGAVNVPLSSGEKGHAGCAVTILPPGAFCGVQTKKADSSCPSGTFWKGRAVSVDLRGMRKVKADRCLQ